MKKEEIESVTEDLADAELLDLGMVSELTEGRFGGNTEVLNTSSLIG